MFTLRSLHHRKVMLYSSPLVICIIIYIFISFGAYYVDSQKNILPAGPSKTNIKKGETPIDDEPPDAHKIQVRTTVSRLAISPHWSNYGLRIFGYLHPAVTDEYIFAVSSDDNSEFWLSTGNEWAAPGEYWKFASQISKPVLLVKDMKYFFEVLLKQNTGMDHLEIAWSLNRDNGTFSVIASEFLSLYEDESSLQMGDIDHIPQTKASYDRLLEPIPMSHHTAGDMIREDPHKLLDESQLKDLFRECHYSPMFPNDYTRQTTAIDDEMCFYRQDTSFQAEYEAYIHSLASYLSIRLASYLTEVEDPDVKKIDTDEGPFWQRVYDVKPLNVASKQTSVVVDSCKTSGNVVMSQSHAMPIVRAFLKALHSREETRSYSLLHVVNVVRREDKDVGSRYLVELELVGPQGQKVLVSRYVYALAGHLEEPPLLCMKNQARWIIQFIREMEKVYRATGDKNFNVIIVDYSSTDIDIEKRLKKAKLPSYKFKKMDGNFQRSGGLQAGIDLVEVGNLILTIKALHVSDSCFLLLRICRFRLINGYAEYILISVLLSQDEHSILFLCDLHLYYPVNIINSIRKHCVEGKMVYAPIVMRLNCGASPRAPAGFWEAAGYGLMGIYKSDMDRIGGMNTREFTDKWGGEDWELLDR
ncbi:Beta-1,4-N-acetylgalactosaminyltransferase 3 [Labeo rohita]|uniref:Beta-1,4-N-acetylgalactosaminyltransferase n=1 Tax=Labeo rohita TaxID=84645 RepID=A0ABQ8MSW7_LABRO|nr:Beta-1,4-N-acetylgalactosaminyltransferase 3 [Labeo rohita]